jgi:unsaturated rhamnogalacturonyl hydrolase
MDEFWDWPCGVAYYGMCEAYDATGDEKILGFLRERINESVGLGLPPWTVNTCAMCHCLIDLEKATGEAKYGEIANEGMSWLRTAALRFGDGALQHTVSSANDFPEQAWADTLMMAGLVMLRAGVSKGRVELVEDALNQYVWHIQYLQDKSSGLWFHGYDNLRKDHMSAIFWARANAWAALSMSQVRRILPQPYLYPQYMDISCSLRDLLAGLKGLQTENGLWRTVLDDEESYEELSATCGIGAAMLANGNPLHTRHAQKALEGVLENLAEDGTLLNVSGGTAVMRDLDGYRKVPKTWVQGWGQGLALAFLASALRSSGS